MKRIIILSTVLLSFLLVSCESMFRPKGISDVSSEVMWTVPDMAQGVLMNAYNDISNNPDQYDGNFLDVATDNAVTSSYSSATYRLSMGSLSSTNNPLGIWSQAYNELQYIHLFLENGLTDVTKYAPGSEEDDAAIKLRLRGEAYYLRAWWSAELLRVYGGRTSDGRALGYPIVTSSLTPDKAGNFSWHAGYIGRDHRTWDYVPSLYNRYNWAKSNIARLGFEHGVCDWLAWGPYIRYDCRRNEVDEIGTWVDFMTDCLAFRIQFEYENDYRRIDGSHHDDDLRVVFFLYLRAFGPSSMLDLGRF